MRSGGNSAFKDYDIDADGTYELMDAYTYRGEFIVPIK